MTKNYALLSVLAGILLFPVFISGQGSWIQKAPLPAPRAELAAVSYNNQVYAVGGTATGGSAMADLTRYDPLTDSWLALAPMPTAREELVAVVNGGILYAIGGGFNDTSLVATEAYFIGPAAWTTLMPMPTGRREANGISLNNQVHVFGGIGTPTGETAVERYDPASNLWTVKNNLNPWRKYCAIGAVNGKIYLIGGDSDNGVSTLCSEYDPVADTWTLKSPMPVGVRRAGSCTVQGKIYIIGGNTGTQNVGDVHVYDPATDSWSTLPALLNPRDCLAAAPIGNTLYAIGGFDQQGVPTDFVEAFDLTTDLAGPGTEPPGIRYANQQIVLSKLQAGTYQLLVYDGIGRMIYHVEFQSDNSQKLIELPGLKTGIYVVSLLWGQGQAGCSKFYSEGR